MPIRPRFLTNWAWLFRPKLIDESIRIKMLMMWSNFCEKIRKLVYAVEGISLTKLDSLDFASLCIIGVSTCFTSFSIHLLTSPDHKNCFADRAKNR